MTNGDDRQTENQDTGDYSNNSDDDDSCSNSDKSAAEYNGDADSAAAGLGDGKAAGTRQDGARPRVNYYKHYVASQPDRLARSKTKQRCSNDGGGECNDSDRSALRERHLADTAGTTGLTERKNGSEHNELPRQTAAESHVNNHSVNSSVNSIRFSATRRSPRKWQLLPLPAASTHKPRPFVRYDFNWKSFGFTV